jgi:hypothetical protein
VAHRGAACVCLPKPPCLQYLYDMLHPELAMPHWLLRTRGLLQDAAELEQIVRRHLSPPDLLRDTHTVFRSFRSLLFTETAAFASSGLSNTIPVATTLLHFFSRLPESVANPYQRTGVTVKQFSQWMDQHTQAEILESISDTLATARVGPDDEPVLAVMRTLMQR